MNRRHFLAQSPVAAAAVLAASRSEAAERAAASNPGPYAPEPKPERAVEDLGTVFELMKTAVKPYPSCRYGHASVDAALARYPFLDGERLGLEGGSYGGQLTDWGGHHPDCAQWGMGTEHTGPVEIAEAEGEFPEDELWNTASMYQFEARYANGVRMIVSSEERGGVRWEGTDGWVWVDREQFEGSNAEWSDWKYVPDELAKVKLTRSSNHFRNFIDSVQITVAEEVGVGSRGGYYEQSGCLRDMIQNHTMQLLALTAMEPPVSMDAESVRDEKVKVLSSIRPLKDEDVLQNTAQCLLGAQPYRLVGDISCRHSPSHLFL